MRPSTCFLALALSSTLGSMQGYAQWQPTTSALRKRSETVSVVYGSKIYTFLGFKDTYLNPEPSSEVFDPATKTWKLLASIPSGKAMTHQGVALIDDDVWHIGGRVGKHPGPLTSEIWIYNITTNSWRRGPMLQDPANGQPLLWGGGGAALLGRNLHIFGGFVQTACNGDQGKYHLTLDVDSWLADTTRPAQWKNILAPMPIPRNHFGTVVLGGKIYAVGGQLGHDCSGGHDRRYVHVYDPAVNIWTELGLLPSSRSHVEGSTFAIDNRIFLVAGQGISSRDTNLVTVFNPEANSGKGTWAHRTDLVLPGKYEGLSAKIVGSQFYISHGGEGSSRNTRNTAYQRTITRKPVYKLGFSTTCGRPEVVTGDKVQFKTLLFTYDGTPAYTATSNVPWLTIEQHATGTVNANGNYLLLRADASGLAPGTYTATLQAVGTGSSSHYTAATYCVQLTVTAGQNLASSQVAPPDAGTTSDSASRVEHRKPSLSLVVAPNPSKGTTRIMLNAPGNEPVHLWLIDGSGKVLQSIRHWQGGGDVVSLYTGNLPAGLYLIKAVQAGKHAHTRLVVER